MISDLGFTIIDQCLRVKRADIYLFKTNGNTTEMREISSKLN